MNTAPILLMLGSYALGCCTTSFYLVRWKTGQDLRQLGSGTLGATNARRVLGPAGFVMSFLFDFLKGALVVVAGQFLSLNAGELTLVMAAVIAGHLWPIQLRFQGGKGVATATGALLMYDPFLALAQIALFAVLWAITRRRTFSALSAYGLLPILAVVMMRPAAVTVAAAGVGVLVLIAHRGDWHLGRKFVPTHEVEARSESET